MAKRHQIYPPLDNRRTRIRRRIFLGFFNVLVLAGWMVLCYLLFSLFDTPSEYLSRQSATMLREQYDELNDRLAELNEVLDNVVDRDRNVFHILFESDPYDLDGTMPGSLAVEEELLSKTNVQLGEIYFNEMGILEEGINNAERLFSGIYTSMDSLGEKMNNIPAIQPVINKDLTLMTASFGMRIHPFYKSMSPHEGVDFTVPEGARVFATADGIIRNTVSRSSASGMSVTISHLNGYETTYSHLSEIKLPKGQLVKRGDIIGLSGNTGLSLAPHLHYEIRYNGQPVDPVNYFFMELSPKQYQTMIKIARSGMQAFD